MHSLVAYSLGWTAGSRARRLRENILRSVERDSKEGRPTRLPFLKQHLCGQDVPWSLPTRAPKYREGTVIRVDSCFPTSGYIRFLDLIREFNQSAMISGLQAVPQEMSGDRPLSFTVCRCPTEVMGDMLFSRVPEPFSKAPGLPGGFYSLWLHQTFIFTDRESDAAHELEHGVHYNINHMFWLPMVHIRPSEAEYLSTLAELMYFDDPMALLRLSMSKWMPMAMRSEEPDEPLFRFAHRLKGRYGMRVDEIAQGAAYTADLPEYAAHRETMIRSASKEYGLTYEHVFGLPLKAIKEIIAGIPL